MKKSNQTLNEIKILGLEAVARELGPYGFVRFLQQYELGAGDYTAERDKLIGDPDINEIERDIRSMRAETAVSKGTPRRRRKVG